MPVRGGRQVTKQLSVAKKRTHQLEVVGVGAAFVRVVEQPDVAVDHTAALLRHTGSSAHGKSHGPDKHGEPRFALHQSVATVCIVQTVTGVMRLGNDGVERAAVQRGVHFIGNLLQTSLEHGERDGIECGRSVVITHGFFLGCVVSIHSSNLPHGSCSLKNQE